MKTLNDFENMTIGDFFALPEEARQEFQGSASRELVDKNIDLMKKTLSDIRSWVADMCREAIAKEIGYIRLEDGQYDNDEYKRDLVSTMLEIIRGD